MGAKRQRKETAAPDEERAKPRTTGYELWPIVVQLGIRDNASEKTAHWRVMEHAEANCSPAVCAVVFKNRARLSGSIHDIWNWEENAHCVQRQAIETGVCCPSVAKFMCVRWCVVCFN